MTVKDRLKNKHSGDASIINANIKLTVISTDDQDKSFVEL